MIIKIIKIIVYKLWVVSSVSLLTSLIVLWSHGVLSALAVVCFGVSGILYSAQDLLLYYPNDPPDSRLFVVQPSNFKLPYESVKITSKDGYKIHLFLIKQLGNCKNVPTLVFFHGNAGNMGQRLVNVSELFNKLCINILMVEYRGYGLSEGSPSEKGLYIDARSALDYLLQRDDIDTSKIIIFGRSLGGAVAIDIAASFEYRSKVWALLVENTFTSIPDMARVVLRWRCLKWLPNCVHKNKYWSIQKISHVMAPTLIICGANDLLVPPSMASELYKRCGAVVKRLLIVAGGGHDDTWTCRDYYTSILQFLAEVPALPADAKPYYDESTSDCPKNIQIHMV